ncbi:YbhN family protein [Albirhodobacter sp. R86504]|uniref:lysylphosphatidylglycerol synthase transmembrane domain-containing protein n=1 Tax=Albirhodobacter sp. R86504 TaxID=3093848 RepID=UPI003670B6E7
MMRGLARLAVVVVLLSLVWMLADGPAAITRLRAADWRWLLAAWLVVNLQTVLSAWRWCVTARALGQTIGLGEATGEYYLAQLVNQTVPGGVVGDAARAVRARHSADLKRSAQAVVIERLAGQIAMAAVFVPALVLTGNGLWALALTVAGAVIWRALRGISKLHSIRAPLARALFAPSVRLPQISLGLAIVLCNIAAFVFCARAISAALSLDAALTVVPLVLTAMLIPFTIAGWGWREGAAAALFPLAGLAPEAGVAASAAFGAVLFACSLPGLAWLGTKRGLRFASPENSHISDTNSGEMK